MIDLSSSTLPEWVLGNAHYLAVLYISEGVGHFSLGAALDFLVARLPSFTPIGVFEWRWFFMA